jgi:hypothetical protein
MRKEGVPFFSAAKERLGPLLTAKASPLIKKSPKSSYWPRQLSDHGNENLRLIQIFSELRSIH